VEPVKKKKATGDSRPVLRKTKKADNIAHSYNYFLLFENMSSSVEYCRMIYKNNKPVDWIFLSVNPAFEQFTGAKDVINRKATEVFPNIKNTNSRLLEIFGRVASTGKPERIEIQVPEGDRPWRSVYAYCPEKGYFVAIMENITKSKLAEQALIESEEKYRNVVENAGEAIYIVQDSRIKFVNNRSLEMVQYSREELLSRPFLEFIHPDDHEMVAQRYLARIKGEYAEPVYYWRFIDKDGSVKWFELRATRIMWEGRPATLNFSTDVTAHKNAEDELQRNSRRMADIIDFLPDATLVLDKNQKVIFWNRAIEEMTGIKASKMIGKSEYVYSIPFYREERPILLNYFWQDIENVHLKYPNISKSGNSLITEIFVPGLYNDRGAWLFVKASPFYDTEGNLQGAIESIRDITDSKKAIEALQKSEEQYRLLAETAEDVIWTIDPNLHFTYVSPSARKMQGYKPEEVLKQSMFEMLTPESLRIALDELERRADDLESGRDFTSRIESEQYRKDGSTVWTESVIRPLYNNQKKLSGFLGISRDISERKASEQALKESEEKFRNLFQNSNDAIFITSKDGRFIETNDSWRKLFGYTLEEIRSLDVLSIYKNVSDRKKFTKDIEKAGSVRNYEITLRKKDGSTIVGMLNSTLRKDKNGNVIGYQGILRDITDIHRLQEERQKIAKLESIGTLAGGIAHDFNNILQGILGNISLARLELQDGSQIDEYLKEAEKASLNARNLTYQFLTFSKGGLPIKKKMLISQCIKDAVTLALRGTNVTFKLQIFPDLWYVDADEGQIGQVITNIAINAQQAMPRGGTINVEAENIKLSGEGRLSKSLPIPNGNYVRIAIEDHGTGIPGKYIHSIFDPYFTTKNKGSGLGLATSYSIVRKHNGHIGVESTVGQGTTFFIYLPAVSPETSRKREKKEKLIKGSGRILLMDDEEIVRTTVAKILKHLGYEFEFARNGEEAIDIYKQSFKSGEPFTAVILDLTIAGGMGGIDTLKDLLKINPELKAIVSSGYADLSAMAEYSNYGFKGMVAKPYTPEQLSKALHDVIKKE